MLLPQSGNAWPQTIVKGYRQCGACHAGSNAGGTAPNDYGRAMAAEFMSTWSNKYDENEFFVTSSQYIDYRVDYRHLYVSTPIGASSYPMLLDVDLILHVAPLAFYVSGGLYSRERNFQSRTSFIKYQPFKSLSFRAGYFMPHFGIGTNDHSLFIKKQALLGRGSETYNIETWGYLKDWFQVFYTVSAPKFRLTNRKTDNLYKLMTPYYETKHFVKAGYIGFSDTEIGINVKRGSIVTEMVGAYIKTAPFITPYYLLAEHDVDTIRETSVTYARLGLYKKGFDIYFELDRRAERIQVDKKFWLGLDWMFRPHFQVSLKVDLANSGNIQGQWFEWL